MHKDICGILISKLWARKIILTLLILITFEIRATTQYQTIELSFSESDFQFSVNDEGEVKIDSRLSFIYPESDQPGLPIISKAIAINGGCEYSGVTFSYEKRELLSDVRVTSSPILVTTEEQSTTIFNANREYDTTKQFPSTNCKYVTTSDWGRIKVLHFLATPFIYDAAQQKLYFIDSITLNIKLEERETELKHTLSKMDSSILKSFVANADRIDELCSTYPTFQALDIEDKIDYVVITNQELADSFKPLCQWKTEKGLYSKVITIEDIATNYPGWNIQLQIKNCLYDLYKHHNLKYVLLGGDDNIVPSRGCYGYVKISDDSTYDDYKRDYSIPTDMYYACFDGCFDWDKNRNGDYGEIADSINLKQSIYITRLPVCTSTEVESFIDKLLKYERYPAYNNSMLTCGVNLYNSGTSTQTDAEQQGNNLYAEYIKPYWNGLRHRFFDSNTDFPGGRDYDVTADNLSQRIEDGYSFIDIITHGTIRGWSMESGDLYDMTYGNTQKNTSQSIVTTTACNTNAFDHRIKNTKCLSTSLIGNPDSGIVAYLGCSREGFGYWGSELGPSLIYEGNFYKNLFTGTVEGLNYGALVAATKATQIANCNETNEWRWLQFGLNPVGDPEMPIWISEPKKLNDVNISLISSLVNLGTVYDECRVCIVDELTHGENYFNVFDATDRINVSDLPEESSICITKPGYIPQQIKVGILQNKDISCNSRFDYDVILCGSSITTEVDEGSFVLKEGKTTLNANQVVLGPGTKVETGAQLVIVNKESTNK